MFSIRWNEKLGPQECPYIQRWVWATPWFSIRLHHWLHSDDLRHPHDHPWDFVAIVLKGSITEVTGSERTKRSTGSIHCFKAEYQHCISVESPVWTLLLTGKEKRVWGYWVNGSFRKRNKYFFEHGHHNPCDTHYET